MHKPLLLLCLFWVTGMAQAQQVSLQAGQSFSKIKFVDSNGNELQNLQTVNHFFMMAEYRQTVFPEQLNSKLFGNLGLRFSGYGSTGSDRVLDNFYEWDLSYLGLVFGLDYEFYEKGRFATFASIKISPEFLIRGSQTINSQVFDLMGEEDFNTPIFFFRGGLGARFQLTNDASIFAQYMIGKSYSFFDSQSSELNIIAQNFGIGLFTDISGGKQKPKRRKK